MNRKDYNLVIDALERSLEPKHTDVNSYFTAVVLCLCDVFEKDNPKFDRMKFNEELVERVCHIK